MQSEKAFQSMVNQTMVARQWVTAKNSTIREKEKADFEKQLADRDSMLREEHSQYSEDIERLRREAMLLAY